MKKAVNILSLISVISLFTMAIIQLSTRNSDMYIKFIVDWFLYPLIFLAIPTFRLLPLAFNKDNIPPQIWLSIYAIIFILFIYVGGFDYVDQTRDLPTAFRKGCVSIEGEAKNLDSTKSSQIFQVANQKFILSKDNFNDVSRNNIYRVEYLPNSNYVINVFDENGRSLLKNRKI